MYGSASAEAVSKRSASPETEEVATTTLTVLSGLIASGKTTVARRLKAKDPSAWIVSRDEIRSAVFGAPNAVADEEELVTAIMIDVGRRALSTGHNVIVDDLNLFPEERERWHQVAEQFSAEIVWYRMSTDVDECIRRDSLRPLPVGGEVIRQFAAAAGLISQD